MSDPKGGNIILLAILLCYLLLVLRKYIVIVMQMDQCSSRTLEQLT